ncbi:MAG: 4'-phosphopantetheinyl transferase superfamily protein [Clostridia bacterium]|nr:4'-phosphopantetheinyl transferase superfamily protein [Clostridia bacterium]
MLKLYAAWAAFDGADRAKLLSACGSLSEKIGSRHDRDLPSALCARFLLAYALRQEGYDDAVFSSIVWEGKPYAACGSAPYFSYTHTGADGTYPGAAAVLLSDTEEVGVDMERIRPMRRSGVISGRLFLEHERAYLARQASDEAFFRIWCAKEAFVKRTGEGFSRPFSTISVDPDTAIAASDGIRCALSFAAFGPHLLCAAAGACARLEPIVVQPHILWEQFASKL